MHDRNIFKAKCFIGAGGKVCMNFSDAEALDVQLPEGYLVPRVPQRLNYLLLLEDLICKNGFEASSIWGIDIGTGASCIFPLLGARLNNWNFVATEVDVNSISYAAQNIDHNNLRERIRVVHSTDNSILKEVLSKETSSQKFTMNKGPPRSATTATPTELTYAGGENSFIQQMLEESTVCRKNVCFFTTMIGKKGPMVSSLIVPGEDHQMGFEWNILMQMKSQFLLVFNPMLKKGIGRLLTGEFVLPCSVHAYILQTYKSKTLDEIVEELELLLDKISDICGNETDFVKLLSFCLALLDCFGDVLFGCETSELRKKLELLHERVRSLTSAQHLFAKNISLIKNKAAFKFGCVNSDKRT
uniref:U6 small nuclear RNA (adenine-(43)-N(6))-methyltransferase n=1 Tax=Globodera rostochiensis TaxID=31243 RepID=A0A914GWE1_GLORO